MNSEESVVVSAPSVDEAISLGLIKLTALRDEVKIEILDEGNRGFLGLGAREAKVKVTRLSEEERRSAEERAQSQALEEVTEPETDIPSSPAEPRERAERDVEPEPVAVSPRPEPTEKTPKVSEKPSQPESVSKPEPAEPQAFEKETPEETKPRMPEMVGGVNRAELEAVARDVAAGLLQDLDVDVTLEWLQEDRPTLWIAVDGKDASALVGSRARTLHSLQYLFRALIYHRLDGDYNLVVDADSYRKRRRQSLENLANRQAKKAIETGETVRLRPMPAHERRIVHITLRDDDRVTTESVGHGRNRLVTIIPRRAGSSS
jgi:spoIIIJ-associated protein